MGISREEALKNPAIKRAMEKIYEQHGTKDLDARVQNAQPEHITRKESLDINKGKKEGPRRIKVRVTRCSRRLLDVDNLGGAKYVIDQLRYCGFIPNDSPKDIKLTLDQKEVKTKKEEGTLIEIEKLI